MFAVTNHLAKIVTRRGHEILIDAVDLALVQNYTWHVNASGYAETSTYCKVSRERENILMHRLILGLKSGDGLLGDHIDEDKLNNRRSNLRICTRKENALNVGIKASNTTGFKGVHFFKRHQKWTASITKDGKTHHLGYFVSPEAAHAAYCEAAKELHGEFANFGIKPRID
jgi:hypothetical protein